jgi:hypothetical protein
MKFSFTEKNGVHLAQCIQRHAVLRNDAMRPGRLERHLDTNHKRLKDKPREFFGARLQCLKRMKLDTTGAFHQNTAKLVEESYELSLLIANAKEAHTIGETLVKSCRLTASNIVLVPKARKCYQISLSDNTVRRRIDELPEDIARQDSEKIKAFFFAIPCDDTTNEAQCCQLLIYFVFVDNEAVNEETLFSKALETMSKASDILATVSDFFFQENGIFGGWGKLVGVCTDGATACLSLWIHSTGQKISSHNWDSLRHPQRSLGCEDLTYVMH